MIKPLSETEPPKTASHGSSVQDPNQVLDEDAERELKPARFIGGFWTLLDTRLRAQSEKQLQSTAAELFRLRQRLLGNPILDLSRILKAVGVEESNLPSPYREALEIGDSSMTNQFLAGLSAARRPRFLSSESSALEKVYDQLASALFESAF
jgi:hypothetical protein